MKRIGFIVFPGFQVMSFAALSVFEFANLAVGEPLYDLHVLSEDGGAVRSSVGLTVETEPFVAAAFDTLIVGGATSVTASSWRLRVFVSEALVASRRVAGICTGAFVLAEAGILDDRRVTTHWAFARELQGRFPKVKVEEDRIFVIDGPVWTSAGMTAGIDLALAMVEKDLGIELARRVARKLVVYHRRAGGQSQFSALLALEPKSDRIQSALTYAKRNLQKPL
ncbi:MAG TPA: AraC family transcriptional regulator, partial [Steroidobacteraceae bacterium]